MQSQKVERILIFIILFYKVVSSHTKVYETRKVDNDYPMVELNVVPDKLVIEDKHVGDYPVHELKVELDKQVIKDQHEKEISVTSIDPLNCLTVIEDNNADIPFKSKRLKIAPITRTDDLFMVIPRSVNLGNVSNLQIFSQNIRGLGNKIDQLLIG
jgi:hypothetical protein